MRKKFLFILICVFAGIVACNELPTWHPDPGNDDIVEDNTEYGIYLDNSRLSLLVGEKETLVATVKFKDPYYGEVKWRTSDPRIATVSGEGVVTAVRLGKTIVSATAAGETAECEIMVFPEESVFIAGYQWTDNECITRVWRNEEVVFEISFENPYICTVSTEGDIYAVYRYGNNVLKNGTVIYNFGGTVSSTINTVVVPESGNIYVGGKINYDNGACDAVIWENEYSFFRSGYDSEIYSLFVSNGSVYAGGWTGDFPSLWRDGMLIDIEIKKFAIIRSIFVADKIYAVGHDGYNAILWENGEIKTVFDGPSEAYSVYKYGEDVYIGGAMNNYPAVWKNGELIFTAEEIGIIRSIDIFDGDVYAVGDEGNKSKAWKNGEVFVENGESVFQYIRKIGKLSE